MMVIWALESLGAIFVIWVFTTQIFLPLWRNTPLMPFFRKTEDKALAEVREAEEDLHVAKLEILADERRQAAQTVRKTRSNKTQTSSKGKK